MPPDSCSELINEPAPIGGQRANPGIALQCQVQIHQGINHLLVSAYLLHILQRALGPASRGIQILIKDIQMGDAVNLDMYPAASLTA